MTKKIGIITINDYGNFGNKLQNYALKHVLESLDLKVDSVRIESIRSESIPQKLLRLGPIGLTKAILLKGFSLVKKQPQDAHTQLLESRTSNFKSFAHKHLNEVFLNTNVIQDVQILNAYDYFVTGSDQVWNPGHPHNVLEVFFCTFAPKEKRIAYSPSFGLTVIPSKLQKYYQAWLTDLAYCSVREPSGAKIIKELTGREVPVLVDPTLLLSAEEWSTLSSPITAKKYILLYYLGKVPDHVMDLAKELSLKHDLEIIHIFNKDIEETYHHGVEDFISYFKSASFVLTDSFHGTVFSIVFSVPFLVSRRVGEGIYAQMYTRLENLLSLFHFESRTFDSKDSISNLFEQDFSKSYEILNTQKQISMNYLKEALNYQESESNV